MSPTTRQTGRDERPVVAIVSNVPSAAVRRDAACLAHAADQLGWTHRKFVLDGPAIVHPRYVQDELASLCPTLIVALDASVGELPYQLPASARIVTLSRTDPDCAIMPAATVIEQEMIGREKSQRIIVLADRVDCCAAAAGLHLASHRKLWQLAEGIILARIDSYDDAQAGEILDQAQRRLEAKIENDGICEGLITRIRNMLGPALVTMSHLRALSEAGLKFDLFGDGWEHEPMAGVTVRGCWPLPDRLANVVERAGIVVTIETGGRLTTGLLDAMAAGVLVMTRSTPAIDASSDLRKILEGSWPIMRYHSRAELLALVRQIAENPSLGKVMADRARARVMERHTWRHRLQSLHASSLHELKMA